MPYIYENGVNRQVTQAEYQQLQAEEQAALEAASTANSAELTPVDITQDPEINQAELAAALRGEDEATLQDYLDAQDINNEADPVGDEDPAVAQANLAAGLRGEDEASLQDLLDANDINNNDLSAESPYADETGIDEAALAYQLEGGGEAGEAAAALTRQAQQQQAVRDQQLQQASTGDWRVKLRLAPGANYLYRAGDGRDPNNILYPLSVTDGVVFPYMPRISTSYHAQYNTYDLTHSNYRGAFYQNSYTGDVTIEADFTAQDTQEANYLLAVIHFFRSATKMFYGQDTNRGVPPPLVYLQGLGQYQFSLHPCVIKDFTYALPNDVDYIRARVTDQLGFNLLQARSRQTLPTNIFSSALQRLQNAGLMPGGAGQNTSQMSTAPTTLGTKDPTYVPTKMTMSIVLLPIQSREQVSKEFSLQKFADGTLIKKGFW